MRQSLPSEYTTMRGFLCVMWDHCWEQRGLILWVEGGSQGEICTWFGFPVFNQVSCKLIWSTWDLCYWTALIHHSEGKFHFVTLTPKDLLITLRCGGRNLNRNRENLTHVLGWYCLASQCMWDSPTAVLLWSAITMTPKLNWVMPGIFGHGPSSQSSQ